MPHQGRPGAMALHQPGTNSDGPLLWLNSSLRWVDPNGATLALPGGTHLAKRSSRCETALVFYSGHGMEVVEKDELINVLAPTNAA